MDDRNDKIEFLNALRKHLEHISVVLIYGIPATVPFPCTVIELKPMTVPEVWDSVPGISQVDALRLTAVTNGIPLMITQYKPHLSFEDNLRMFFLPGSVFCAMLRISSGKHFAPLRATTRFSMQWPQGITESAK